jgi:hypothetical protein
MNTGIDKTIDVLIQGIKVNFECIVLEGLDERNTNASNLLCGHFWDELFLQL